MFIVRIYGLDPWTLTKRTFPLAFTLALVFGSTQGLYFISPTDSWVEIIVESLAVSLISTVVMIMGAEAYFRWSARDSKKS